MQPAYTYSAQVVRVVDGDTLDLLIDLGFRSFRKERIRLYGINTPEIYGVSKDSPEYQAGQAASTGVREWLAVNADTASRVAIWSYDGKDFSQGKYGRWLAEVFSLGANEQSLNSWLVEQGLAEIKTY